MVLDEFFVRFKWFNSYVYSFFPGLIYAYDFSRLESLPDVCFRLLLNIELLVKQLDMNGSFERPECFLCELDDFPNKIENFLFSGNVFSARLIVYSSLIGAK